MKQEIKHIGLFVILPLLLASFALYYIGIAEAVQYEEAVQYQDPTLKQGGQRQIIVSEEEPVSPIIKIIGIEQ